MPKTSRLLAAAGVAHGFGTVADGDFRKGSPPPGIAVAHQVHGTAVAWPSQPGRLDLDADALAAGKAEHPREFGVGVLTADCVPLLLADPQTGLVAAVHAGWRGTLNGVVRRAVEALVSEGAEPSRLLAAIGPCIRACCYEVSQDLLAQFERQLGSEVAHPGSHLDLPLANRVHLTVVGISPANVDDLGECTRCGQKDDSYLYYSHRRTAESAGRQLSWVWAPGVTLGPVS